MCEKFDPRLETEIIKFAGFESLSDLQDAFNDKLITLAEERNISQDQENSLVNIGIIRYSSCSYELRADYPILLIQGVEALEEAFSPFDEFFEIHQFETTTYLSCDVRLSISQDQAKTALLILEYEFLETVAKIQEAMQEKKQLSA